MSTTITRTASIAAPLRELAALLPGQVSHPGQPDWDEVRLAWSRGVDQRPLAVVAVAETEDVVATVRWALRHGRSVTAQPVGHAATTELDGAVLLRTRGLTDIEVDAGARTARVGAGVKWGELLAATAPYGLTGLAGSSGDPSVVGLTLGGGLSWYGRSHGLAAHSVLAFEIVDATGTARRITRRSDPDLFWAMCGGGGDFAVVTAMTFALYPAPHVYGGRLLWPAELARPVLRAFRDLTRTAPEGLTLWWNLLQLPPIPEVPALARGGSFVDVDLAFLGSAAEAEALLAPLRAVGAPVLDTLGTVPIDQLGGIAAEPTEPMPSAECSGLLRDLDDAAIDALLAVTGPGSGSALVDVQLRHLGGALARGSSADGPAGAVLEPYSLFCLGVPADPEAAAQVEATMAEVRSALQDVLTGRSAFNFLGSTGHAAQAFSGVALKRLRDIKRSTDPASVFRSNRPVLRQI